MPDDVHAAIDLTHCDREPIHIPGALQSHGALLACDEALGEVARASTNASALLKGRESEFIGRRQGGIFGEFGAYQIRNAAAISVNAAKPGLLMGLGFAQFDGAFDLAVHRHKGAAIVERERSPTNAQVVLSTLRAL